MKARIGVAAAIAAGAWVGLWTDFMAIPSEYGWERFHLSTASLVAAFSFVAAFFACEQMRRRHGARWYLVIPVACALGSSLFVVIWNAQALIAGHVIGPQAFLTFSLIFWTILTVPVATGVVVVAHALFRVWYWLRRGEPHAA